VEVRKRHPLVTEPLDVDDDDAWPQHAAQLSRDDARLWN
jgi:hypothetical protein